MASRGRGVRPCLSFPLARRRGSRRSCRRTRRSGRWRPLSPSSSVSARTLGSPDTWVPPPRYLGPWTPQSPPRRMPGSLPRRTLGSLDSWVSPPTLDTWVSGHQGPPHAGHLGPWISGSPQRRALGSPDSWVGLSFPPSPPPDTWVSGHRGPPHPRYLGPFLVTWVPPCHWVALGPMGGGGGLGCPRLEGGAGAGPGHSDRGGP